MPNWVIYFKVIDPMDDVEDRHNPEQCSIVESDTKEIAISKLRKELHQPGEYIEIIDCHQVKING
jgi:hypothetical protein